eukprot:TRINITY_DN3701_c0_g1_i1.p1 TRINITY_DN3701_c0_g1~~TRINITY_DN3701_c0_g1_i1.p1  ORF type:complete len:215 (-),score=48.40 TRINITY_DN3701_c0_g1_i1:40-684(-)
MNREQLTPNTPQSTRVNKVLNFVREEETPIKSTVKKQSRSTRLPEGREPLRVVFRAREHPNSYIEYFSHNCINIKSDNLDSKQNYTFSKVFPANCTQKDIFVDVTLPLMNNLMDGKNGLLFSYGVTNAGKTYTIFGTEENKGILPRTLKLLFKSLHNANDKDDDDSESDDDLELDVDPNYKHAIIISFCEIYNEEIFDLFEITKQKKLKIVERR